VINPYKLKYDCHTNANNNNNNIWTITTFSHSFAIEKSVEIYLIKS